MTIDNARVMLAGAVIGAATLFLSAGVLVGSTTGASAGQCYDLWYQRNAIFASRGYCFKGCGRRVWGANCFGPHFGKLTPAQWSIVNQIKAQERAINCPACPQPSQ